MHSKYGRGTICKEKRRANYKRYLAANPLYKKFKGYRWNDKLLGVDSIGSYAEMLSLIEGQPSCFYCEERDITQLGLDRLDNNKGHSADNVVVCCEKCNIILGDIPFSVKVLLSQGLTEARKKGLLKEWTVPMKRRKQS